MSLDDRKPLVFAATDDHHFRDFIVELLERQGYEVLCAENDAQAVAAVSRARFDLALLDVDMPHWNGISLCKIIKSGTQSKLIPVILVTAHINSDFRIEGIEAGADEFLTKSVNSDELIARVRSLITVKLYTDELEHAEAVLFSLASSIESRDRYTRGHCERLSAYSVALAGKLGLPADQRNALRRAGVVHDIGKVVIPDAVLLKAGPLNSMEWQLMKLHPVVGAEICSPLKSFQLVLPIIRHHHEKMNGSGYPDGLKGDQIPITARILATTDVFDALTTKRPYKDALSVDEALEIMQVEAQKELLDRCLVDEFASLILNRSLAIPERVASDPP